MRSDSGRSGIPYDPPATRVERLREVATILRALFRERRASFDGAYYRVRDAEGRPRPRSGPGPRLVIGGGSPRVLGIAAELELQVLAFVAQVVPDREAVLERLAPAFGLEPKEAGEIPLALVGSVAEPCETLERRRKELGVGFWVVHDTAMEAFAPVVERLSGR